MAQEITLTQEQEDTAWRLIDAWEFAKAGGDPDMLTETAIALVDFQLSVGLLTRAELRRMQAPYLLTMVSIADRTTEGRQFLQKLRGDAMELLNGDDYDEKAGAALAIMTIDAVQGPRRAEAAHRRARSQRQEWKAELQRIQEAGEFGCMLLWRHAHEDQGYFIGARGDFLEAWSAAKRTHDKAGFLLKDMGFKPHQPTGHMQRPRKESAHD